MLIATDKLMSYFSKIKDPHSVITPIESVETYSVTKKPKINKYSKYVQEFSDLINSSISSNQLLEQIRDSKFKQERRMSYLKLFRRCVSPVCDTEATKKIRAIPTSVFINNYSQSFTSIEELKKEYVPLKHEDKIALSILLGEYDKRGEQGYYLTEKFFDWVESNFSDYVIKGPRGAGKDLQLRDYLPKFESEYPCDFIVFKGEEVVCVGFARYDSTRGGAQSDDRTGGNSDKVAKAKSYFNKGNPSFKILFLSDGPGLTHNDTWKESCVLDDKLNGLVRVTTLKTLQDRVTEAWLGS